MGLPGAAAVPMRAYYDNVQSLMEVAAGYDGFMIFQTEPDSTTWLRQYHTGGSWDGETDQSRFVTWIRTISSATGLRYIHWQTVIGAADYGLMPDYPTVERITPLVEAGSIANLFDLYALEGPPHSQPWHGYSSSSPPSHPAYNALDKLAECLGRYFAAPISIPR